MNKGGRPRKWNNAKKLEEAIEEYFKSCEGTPVYDTDGKLAVYKGVVIYKDRKPPTVSGLAYWLGFQSTQSLFDYQKEEKFSAIITRAKLRIESYLEERLMDRDGQRGAEFNLRCNFKWNDKQDVGNDDDKETGVVMMVPVIEEPEEEKEGEKEDVQTI